VVARLIYIFHRDDQQGLHLEFTAEIPMKIRGTWSSTSVPCRAVMAGVTESQEIFSGGFPPRFVVPMQDEQQGVLEEFTTGILM